MRLAIASGKGGTGKTTVAVNLALYLQELAQEVSLLDCDVEEPNVQYFLKVQWAEETAQTVPVPRIDTTKCQGQNCKYCVQECRFKALIWMVDSVLVFPELCHGCGLCMYLCPEEAIQETTREIGLLRWGRCNGLLVHGGILRIGEAMAPPLISRVLESAPGTEIQIADSPPGTSCPLLETVRGSDYTILVAEPTPFGVHDFRITAQVLQKMQKPFGVVINRDGMGDDQLDNLLKQEKIPVLARLPYSPDAARSYSRGEALIHSVPGFKELYRNLWENLLGRLQERNTSAP